MAGDPTILVLDRGDLPGLAACAIQARPESLVLFHPVEPDVAAPARRHAVEAHARAWGVRRLIVSPTVDLGLPGTPPPPELFQASLLLQAAAAARQIGARQVVWPIVRGPSADAVTEVLDRAHAVAWIADPQAGSNPAFELPLVDLSDGQVVDLAEDGAAPMRAFWPCEHGGEHPCGTCEGCGRWIQAFRDQGLEWPWPLPVAAAAV